MARRDLKSSRFNRSQHEFRQTRLAHFVVERQLVQHVGQRSRVHYPVLNGHAEQLAG